MRTPEGPKQIESTKDLMDMFPDAEGDIMKAYEMAGIAVEEKWRQRCHVPRA